MYPVAARDGFGPVALSQTVARDRTGDLSARACTDFHSYLGFGWKAGELYTSMYLKPNTLSAPRNGS